MFLKKSRFDFIYNNCNFEDFWEEFDQLLKRYNISIAHEDTEGSFILEVYKDYNYKWLRNAQIGSDLFVNHCLNKKGIPTVINDIIFSDGLCYATYYIKRRNDISKCTLSLRKKRFEAFANSIPHMCLETLGIIDEKGSLDNLLKLKKDIEELKSEYHLILIDEEIEGLDERIEIMGNEDTCVLNIMKYCSNFI